MVEKVLYTHPAASPEELKAGKQSGVTSDSVYVHGGVTADSVTGAMLTPLFQTTAYKQWSVERYQESGYTYSRCANPTVSAFEAKVAALEGAKCPAVTFGTGMAAFNALMATFASTGDHVLVTRCSYGGVNRASRVLWAKRFGVNVEFVDFTDLTKIENAIIPGRTRMVISETPCNPVLELADIEEISKLCRKKESLLPEVPPDTQEPEAGAGPSRSFLKSRIIHVCDTTLAPPPVLRGLDFGADVLLLSLTKYYCGHNMYLGGALVTSQPELHALMQFKQNVMGSIMTPATAFGMLQTAKTMNLRVKKQSENALAIATFLEKHPKVLWVRYPGLASHPQREIAKKQYHNGIYGGMVAFEVKGGSEAGRRVMNACTAPWTLAENLGAVESIMTCPSVFTHSNMTREAREAAGITDGMIRLSVGTEDTNDLVSALALAMEAA